MKVMENAREAVANGSAGTLEIEMATNGVEVTHDGKVVPASPPLTNGSPEIEGTKVLGKRRLTSLDEEHSPRNRMDIGLHNQADFEYTEI